MSKQLEEFRKDLDELLAKHNAVIDWYCEAGSDTWGIHGDYIGVSFLKEADNGNKYYDGAMRIWEDD